jgi:hypothetical protein
MKLPRRRSSRPRGRARLALAGDFPDTGEAITDVLDRVRPPGYDGRTYQFTGASGAGLPDGGIYPAPPRTHQAAGRGWVMTVDTAVPSGPMDPRVRRARDFIELEVADLAAQGMLYRIDDAEQVRQRGEELDERSLIALTVAKAARHLMGPREPWDLMGPREPWDPS